MNTTILPASPARTAPGFWQRALRHPGFLIGGVLSLLLLLTAALSYLWTPYSVYDVDMDAKQCAMVAPPYFAQWSEEHPQWQIRRWKCQPATLDDI